MTWEWTVATNSFVWDHIFVILIGKTCNDYVSINVFNIPTLYKARQRVTECYPDPEYHSSFISINKSISNFNFDCKCF